MKIPGETDYEPVQIVEVLAAAVAAREMARQRQISRR
jgi:hypothetical protein